MANLDLPHEQALAVLQALQTWLSQNAEGQTLLQQLQTNPQNTGKALATWFQQHTPTMPPQLATYVSGGQIDKLITIAQAGIVIFQSPQPTISSAWYVPYQRNPFFTGREDILQRIHDIFTSAASTPIRPQAISGMGGIGKTQIALEYTYRYKSEYISIFWLKADSIQTLTANFISLAYLLNLPEKTEQDQNRVIQAVQSWLNNHGGWLLIFDNIDEMEIVRDFLPSAGKGHVLLTTRLHSARRLAHFIPIDKMQEEEGVLFLLHRATLLAPETPLKATTAQERTLAKDIVKGLEGYPLALDQAGAYIEETACSLSEYLQVYYKHQAELLKQRGKSTFDHPESVTTTFSLSFKKIARNNRAAVDILRLLAFFHPDAIPEELFTEGAADLGPLQPVVTDKGKWNEAIGALLKYSLISSNTTEKTFTVHRLIQFLLKEEMSENTQRRWALRAVRVVNKVFQDPEFKRWERYWLYVPQAFECAKLIQDWEIIAPEARELLKQTGSYLQSNMRYTEAESLTMQAVEILHKQVANPDPLEMATGLNSLALLYRDQGKYAEAEPLYQRALAIWEQVLGPEHPATATSLNALIVLYQKQGADDRVESLYKNVLAIREKILGSTHITVFKLLNDLAYLYYDQERYSDTETLYRRALEICEHTPKIDPLLTAFYLNNLAATYDAQGQYAKAEPFYQRALSIREKILGPDHDDVVLTLENYAGLLRKSKRKKEAATLETRIILIRNKKQSS